MITISPLLPNLLTDYHTESYVMGYHDYQYVMTIMIFIVYVYFNMTVEVEILNEK